MRRAFASLALLFLVALPVSADEFTHTVRQEPDGPVAVAVIEIGPELSERAPEYGEREMRALKRRLEGALVDALLDVNRFAERETGEANTLLVVIEDVAPNRPTFQQFIDRPGISARTAAIGGARVTAVLSDPAGEELGRYAYAWRSPGLDREQYVKVWTDAEHAFDQFAAMIAAELADPQPVAASP